MNTRYEPWVSRIEAIARRAGAAIMQVYAGVIDVRTKADASPVTAADDAAEAIIVPALQSLTPDIAVISEEASSRGQSPAAAQRFWLVDPLDGTREFISRNGEFTVNIALIENGVPVLGVVYAPALRQLFSGGRGLGAFLEDEGGRRAIAARRAPPEGVTVVSSRSHGDEAALALFLRGRAVASSATAGSSLKFCLLATGQADLYPRLGRTMEWDTAAGDAVLRAAGGHVRTLDGADLTYGKPGLENPHFCASGVE